MATCENRSYPEDTIMTKVIIIGAGIGGIATANLLAKAGYSVSVYEKNSDVGGRAGILTVDGFRFDTGPSWYLMPEVFEHYFSLLDKDITKELDLVRLSPAYKVFFETKPPLTILSDIEQDAATFEMIEPGAGAALQRYVKDGEMIYRLSLKHFLYSNFSSPFDFLKRDIITRSLTLLRRAFTPIDTYVSNFVRDQRLKQILEYPMVFLGTSPFEAPAIYSLMSALDLKEGVFYPKGGMYTIIERLYAASKELGVTYYLNSPVKSINTKNRAVTGITLQNGQAVAADIVISNADLHHTETSLLSAEDQSYPATYWDKQKAGPSALLLYLGVKGTLPNLEHHNLIFVDEWKKNFTDIYTDKVTPIPASMYVCKPSTSDSTVAPEGHENIFILVPLPPDASVEASEIEHLANIYIEQFSRMTGIADFSERIVSRHLFGPDDFRTKFYAWQATALGPSHILKQSALFRTPNKSRKITNLYYVGGSTTPGIGLPMCLIGAELVYKRLAGDKKGGPVHMIEQLIPTKESTP